jgi:hypothetical protein
MKTLLFFKTKLGCYTGGGLMLKTKDQMLKAQRHMDMELFCSVFYKFI